MKAKRFIDFVVKGGENGIYEEGLVDIDKKIEVKTKFITKSKRSGIWTISGFIEDAKGYITIINEEIVRISLPQYITKDNILQYCGNTSYVLEEKYYMCFSDYHNRDNKTEVRELIATLEEISK